MLTLLRRRLHAFQSELANHHRHDGCRWRAVLELCADERPGARVGFLTNLLFGGKQSPPQMPRDDCSAAAAAIMEGGTPLPHMPRDDCSAAAAILEGGTLAQCSLAQCCFPGPECAALCYLLKDASPGAGNRLKMATEGTKKRARLEAVKLMPLPTERQILRDTLSTLGAGTASTDRSGYVAGLAEEVSGPPPMCQALAPEVMTAATTPHQQRCDRAASREGVQEGKEEDDGVDFWQDGEIAVLVQGHSGVHLRRQLLRHGVCLGPVTEDEMQSDAMNHDLVW
jgi:hypothetical protein